MDDVPWLYVAMIFIAFVSWVVNRIREAAEYRRIRKAERAAAERSRRTTAPPSPYREEKPKSEKSFRDIYQELERRYLDPSEWSETEEPEPEPNPQRSVPPPLPAGSPRKAKDPVPADTGKYPTTTAGPIEVAPPLQLESVAGRPARGLGKNLVGFLKDGEKLKTALILQEVLGPPRSRRR